MIVRRQGSGKRLKLIRLGLLLIVAFWLWTSYIPEKLVAQQAENSSSDRLSSLEVSDWEDTQIETSWVFLDGRRILLIAAPTLDPDEALEDGVSLVEQGISPVKRRLDRIQRRLNLITQYVCSWEIERRC